MSFKQEDADYQAGNIASVSSTSSHTVNNKAQGRHKVSRGPVSHKLPINEEFASEIFTGEHNYEAVQNTSQHEERPVSERSAWN